MHSPSLFVESGVFHMRLKAEGIERPENSVEYWKWCEDLGLPEFAHKLVMAHHRLAGTSPTPMERGAWRLYLHGKRHGIFNVGG